MSGATTGRFVVLRHELPATSERGSHWDLLLEAEGVLRAWALDAPPRAGETTTGRALPDHRLAYLDYEGPVSGDRGTVRRTDEGTYRLERDEPGEFAAWLEGREYRGPVRLTRAGDAWRARFDA